ncbi:MAG: aminotransferase class V-fold PLP-dependent enzyme [Pseudohongiellaceae bacterium]
MLDIAAIRAQIPAVDQLLHFNNAGCALSPDVVTEAVFAHLRREQSLGGYEAANQAQAEIDKFYLALANLLNCKPEAIAFIENATRAWEMALHSLPLQADDEIITFESEYASNYLDLLHLAKQRGVKLIHAPFNSKGLVDLEGLEACITPKTRLIALTHVASQRGDVQPATAVGQISRQHGLYYLLDACQSAGQIDLDVAAIGCDFLCGTGRKYLRGPRGTGFLYVNPARLPELKPVFADLQAAVWLSRDEFEWRGDARRFETFERSVAGMIGLGVAIEYANTLNMAAIETRVRKLAMELVSKVADVPGVRVHEKSGERSGIVTLTRENIPAASLQQLLHRQGVNTSVSRGANARLDLEPESVGDVLRASIHYYNTEAEIDRFVELLAACQG